MFTARSYRESDVVRVTFVILFLCLVVIYVAYFQLEDSSSNESTQPVATTGQTAVATTTTLSVEEPSGALDTPADTVDTSLSVDPAFVATGLASSLEKSADALYDPTSIAPPSADAGTGNEAAGGDVDLGELVDEAIEYVEDDSEIVLPNELIVFSGTREFLGDVEATQVLGIDHKYVLTDNKAYYVYLGTGDYDFAPIARSLGGNIVEIVTEIDILKNDLFGEKITFVNIPGVTYTTVPVEQKIKVFMIVRYNNDRRLVQVDYASYYGVKQLMKKYFAAHYES